MKIKGLLDDQPQENIKENLKVDFIQPWSNMICKFKLPDHIFEKLLELYNQCFKNIKYYKLL